MSTYAAIFLKDEKTGLYNGISVKYDGYINGGVGETLYRNWRNLDDIKRLCNGKRTDMRILGKDMENSEWFSDETPGRKKHFKNLHVNEMLKESKNISYNYTYVYEEYTNGPEWFIIDRNDNDKFLLMPAILD